MREIEFGGKRIDNDEWVYGYFVNEKGAYYIVQEETTEVFVEEFYNPLKTYVETVFHKVIPETVSQFTGLLDKNGNKIFEGDILKHDVQGERIVYYPFNKNSAIFGLECLENGYKSYLVNSSIYEIIGNIHN